MPQADRPGAASNRSMTAVERRSSISLAAIFALRMLGLFMIYPVFAVYATQLRGATPASIGLALGSYGLTQALLQIPFGTVSDRLGRKPVIAFGLLVFAAGSAIAAMAGTIDGVILGRILQGAGAVGSTILALGADLTRESQRTKTMAVIGMTVGASFAVAVVAGPLLDRLFGVPGIFWLTAVLAAVGIAVLYVVVPSPAVIRRHRDAEAVPGLLRVVLADRALLRLDFGIMALHAILTATFVALPLALHGLAGVEVHSQWLVYLPVLLLSVAGMVPMIIAAERYGYIRPVFLAAIAALALAQLALAQWHASLALLVAALVVFFTAFNFMEASLPSLVSREAPAAGKGTALGVYSSSQFLGIFLGGTLGGWLQGYFGIEGVFVFCALVAGAWLLMALGMRPPTALTSFLLSVGEMDESEARALGQRLGGLPGVAEAEVAGDEGVAYLKIDRRRFDEQAVRAVACQMPQSRR